ncbi:MAG: pirin family protein [Halanaerobiales bacterium]
MLNKKIKKIKSVMKDEGEGAMVKRLFPTENYNGHHDPFVLMDEFFVDPPNSFPAHEHRGFEAITYMLEGSFRHEDNEGNKAEVGPGGVQAFNAGRSIVHSEAPGSDKGSHGIQLWINLPADKKMSDPEYQQIKAGDIHENFINEKTNIRTIVGKESSLKLHTEISYLDIKLPVNELYEYSLPDNYKGIIYVIKGKLLDEDNNFNITDGEGLLIDEGIKLKLKTLSDTRFIELKGKPHGYDIKIKGSFVE